MIQHLELSDATAVLIRGRWYNVVGGVVSDSEWCEFSYRTGFGQYESMRVRLSVVDAVQVAE